MQANENDQQIVNFNSSGDKQWWVNPISELSTCLGHQGKEGHLFSYSNLQFKLLNKLNL